MNYWKFEISVNGIEQAEVVSAILMEAGFEGVEETEQWVVAYGKESAIDPTSVQELLTQQLGVSYVQSLLPEKNWNEVWESNFSPVKVNNFVAIRAPFHEPITNVMFELVIMPKMSFGTGHHATTFSVIDMMQRLQFANKTVCDYGSGTGVLAIVAEKMGASSIMAIDNDEWSLRNANENMLANQCKRISVVEGNSIPEGTVFDCILANINRNVLWDQMAQIAASLTSGGDVLLSGFYESDAIDLIAKAKEYGLLLIDQSVRNQWVCLYLQKAAV